MALTSFELNDNTGNFTLLDNNFITNYLGAAPSDAVRVYLYGLYHAGRGTSLENTSEGFSIALGLSEADVFEHFSYWHEKGLVTIVSRSPLEVRYMSPKSVPSARKFAPAKYVDFNKTAEAIFTSRQVTANEFLQYYELLEDTGITPDALLMIMKFCVDQKGESVRYPYIITVAKDWADGKRLTAGDVEEHLKRHEAMSENMRELFCALGKTGKPQFEDKQSYLKWSESWGYGHEEIMYAAGLTKKRGGMARLEKILDEFFRHSCFNLTAMKAYRDKKDSNFKLTIEIARRLTCYFENLDYVIESYTEPWLKSGLTEKELLDTAERCFKKNKRDFESMDATIKGAGKSGGGTKREYTEDDFVELPPLFPRKPTAFDELLKKNSDKDATKRDK